MSARLLLLMFLYFFLFSVNQVTLLMVIVMALSLITILVELSGVCRESGEFYLSSAASTMQNSVQNYVTRELPQIDALTSDLNLNSGFVSHGIVTVILWLLVKGMSCLYFKIGSICLCVLRYHLCH